MTLTVRADEPFAVRLGATPSTGYLWEIWHRPAEFDFLGSEVEAPAAGSQPGQGSVQIFHFRVAQAGKFEIEFRLKRPWEESAIQSQTIRIDAV